MSRNVHPGAVSEQDNGLVEAARRFGWRARQAGTHPRRMTTISWPAGSDAVGREPVFGCVPPVAGLRNAVAVTGMSLGDAVRGVVDHQRVDHAVPVRRPVAVLVGWYLHPEVGQLGVGAGQQVRRLVGHHLQRPPFPGTARQRGAARPHIAGEVVQAPGPGQPPRPVLAVAFERQVREHRGLGLRRAAVERLVAEDERVPVGQHRQQPTGHGQQPGHERRQHRFQIRGVDVEVLGPVRVRLVGINRDCLRPAVPPAGHRRTPTVILARRARGRRHSTIRRGRRSAGLRGVRHGCHPRAPGGVAASSHPTIGRGAGNARSVTRAATVPPAVRRLLRSPARRSRSGTSTGC